MARTKYKSNYGPHTIKALINFILAIFFLYITLTASIGATLLTATMTASNIFLIFAAYSLCKATSTADDQMESSVNELNLQARAVAQQTTKIQRAIEIINNQQPNKQIKNSIEASTGPSDNNTQLLNQYTGINNSIAKDLQYAIICSILSNSTLILRGPVIFYALIGLARLGAAVSLAKATIEYSMARPLIGKTNQALTKVSNVLYQAAHTIKKAVKTDTTKSNHHETEHHQHIKLLIGIMVVAISAALPFATLIPAIATIAPQLNMASQNLICLFTNLYIVNRIATEDPDIKQLHNSVKECKMAHREFAKAIIKDLSKISVISQIIHSSQDEINHATKQITIEGKCHKIKNSKAIYLYNSILFAMGFALMLASGAAAMSATQCLLILGGALAMSLASSQLFYTLNPFTKTHNQLSSIKREAKITAKKLTIIREHLLQQLPSPGSVESVATQNYHAIDILNHEINNNATPSIMQVIKRPPVIIVTCISIACMLTAISFSASFPVISTAIAIQSINAAISIITAEHNSQNQQHENIAKIIDVISLTLMQQRLEIDCIRDTIINNYAPQKENTADCSHTNNIPSHDPVHAVFNMNQNAPTINITMPTGIARQQQEPVHTLTFPIQINPTAYNPDITKTSKQ